MTERKRDLELQTEMRLTESDRINKHLYSETERQRERKIE
jgi:hypothetical protein